MNGSLSEHHQEFIFQSHGEIIKTLYSSVSGQSGQDIAQSGQG